MDKKARAYVTEKHKAQKYGDKPYTYHLFGVAHRAAELIEEYLPNASLADREVIVCSALLHDVSEDCGVSISELSAEFSPKIASCVSALTHAPTVSYHDYILAIRSGPVHPRIVKMADLDFNSRHTAASVDTCPPEKRKELRHRLEKYRLARTLLHESCV